MEHESLSFWQKEFKLPTFPPLKKNLTADVCIVGAGIAGVTAAYLLSKAGKYVVLLDDGPIAGGQTVRTTAHLATALDDRYYNLQSYFGKKGAQMAAHSHQAAIDFIWTVIKKHQIDCDFEHVKAYLFAAPGHSIEILKKELKAAHSAGLKNVSLLDRAPLGSFNTGPALCFPFQAEFSPLPYLARLCEMIQSQKGEIYCGNHVKKITEKNKSFKIEIDQGIEVKAKHVVLATNSYIGSKLFPHTKLAPYRTYVIGAEVPRGYVKKGLYYDTLDSYHYIRTAPYNTEFDLLIVGGEDHRTGEQKDISSYYKNLEDWARHRFPLMQRIKYKWSGQVLEPIDSLAFIGRTKKGSEKYLITGDSGNGMTHGTLGAILIHDLILGKKNPWESLYDPNRISFKNAADFLKENLDSFWQYRDWVTPAETKKKCGVIVREGMKKFACYKDDEGKIHKISATCPHLGAIVRWNELEHCWECPAHGSRFSVDGTVIQGPANCDLEKK